MPKIVEWVVEMWEGPYREKRRFNSEAVAKEFVRFTKKNKNIPRKDSFDIWKIEKERVEV